MKKILQKVRFFILDAYYAVKDKCWNRRIRRKYPDFKGETEYDDGIHKFIWGVKSNDCLYSSDASLYTMNDIDIIYSREKRRYLLDIETIYWFETQECAVEYFRYLLRCFTYFMDEHGYNKNAEYRFRIPHPSLLMEGEDIPELYTNFKIFVEGYTKIYTEHKAVQ